MKFPNAYFGNGPGQGEDGQRERDLEAYQRNRLQMTVATSTFAGVALVGMFCSCLWFLCCRNSSSKTRKKPRTWASAEAGLQNNPYSYDGYLESQGHYMQMTGSAGGSGDGGVAPYLSNPLYHPNSLSAENALPNPYDFTEQYDVGKLVGGGGAHNKAQLNQLFCGTAETSASTKDVPPSYTALFFAASDPASGGSMGKGVLGGNGSGDVDPKVTNIQPIHLKVTSSSEQKKTKDAAAHDADDQNDYYHDGFLHDRPDPSSAPPVSLLSVESDTGSSAEGKATKKSSDETKEHEGGCSNGRQEKSAGDNPPPYNPEFITKKF